MIEAIKETFKMCKEFIVEFFSSVNDSIKHNDLLDAYMMLFIGGFVLTMIGFLIVVIVCCPYILLLLLIPLLPCIYILWMKRLIKNKEDK